MLIWRCVKLPQSWFVSHHKKMPFLALQESVILPKRFSLSEKKGHWMSVFPPSPRPVSWKICLSSFLYGFRGLTSLLNKFVFPLKYSNSIEWMSAPLLHKAIEKEGILKIFSNDNSLDQPPFLKQRGYQARVTQGAPFCHAPTITGKHQPRVGACLIAGNRDSG